MKFATRLLLSLLLISCHSNLDDKQVTADLVRNPLTADHLADKVLMPEIKMDNEVFNFGDIYQGESISHEFILRNIGDADLIISAAKGSCGCTVPEWPKEPISKDKDAIIRVTFNSAGKLGKQNKKVTLVTNAIPNTKVLTIEGNIIVPEKK